MLHVMVCIIFCFREIRFNVHLVFGNLKMGVLQFIGVAPKEFEEFTPTLKMTNSKEHTAQLSATKTWMMM